MNNLKMLRSELGLSLRQLSSKVDIDFCVLSYLELEKRKFREIHIQKLSYFFDVSSDFLLGYADNGIGVYFETSNDNDDHCYITYQEYISLKTKTNISITIIPSKNSINLISENPKETNMFYQGNYSVFRSVEIDKEHAGINTGVRESINSELDHLDIYDLEKVLRFIKDYINK